MTHENDEHPNDPLRVRKPLQAWPPGQPPVTPIGPWGPAPTLGTFINRAWYWKPDPLVGYVPILKRLQINVRDLSGPNPVFSDGTFAPSMLIAFLDPNDDDTPSTNQEFSVIPAGLVAPTGCEVIFYAAVNTVGIVNATNRGEGYEFGRRTPERYYGIYVHARDIPDDHDVSVTAVIEYVEKGVGQGG